MSSLAPKEALSGAARDRIGFTIPSKRGRPFEAPKDGETFPFAPDTSGGATANEQDTLSDKISALNLSDEDSHCFSSSTDLSEIATALA